jgi:hypothetical protein
MSVQSIGQEITFAELDTLAVAVGAAIKGDIIAASRTEAKFITGAAQVTDADADVTSKGTLTFKNGANQTRILSVPTMGKEYAIGGGGLNILAAEVDAIGDAFLAIVNDGAATGYEFTLVKGIYNSRTRKAPNIRTLTAETASATDDSGNANAAP